MNTSTQGKSSWDTGNSVGLNADGAVRTLASSIFEKLRKDGCNAKDIITVSSHLISMVTDELHQKSSLG